MTRRKAAARARQIDPQAVLTGRVKVGVEEVFRLIHRVNPTGRGRRGRRRADRYALKARLQSFLVRKFGDEHLEVSQSDPGVVSLQHRSGTRDACHAVVDQLEPDARSWVRRHLDVAVSSEEVEAPDDSGAASAGGSGPGGAEAAIALGRQAVELFDYEAAEAHLRAAFEQSSGAAPAAVALLELLVDHLGQDQAALELEAQLDAEAHAQPAVRLLVGLAAARQGLAGRVPELLRGVASPRAAEAWAALAGEAVRRGDLEAAGRFLRQTAERDPTHPQIPSLKAAIGKLEEERLASAEEELLERYERLGARAVEEEARSLAERWPGCPGSRRILAELARKRRETEIARHLETGERALAEGRFEEAARRLAQALEAGCERPELAALIEQAERRGRRQREDAQVAQVARRLGEEPREGLAAYLALEPALRARVRRHSSEALSAQLVWLDELEAPASGSQARAALAAVQALAAAVEADRCGRARAVLETLAPHERVLAGHELAQALLRRARRRLGQRRRRRASSTLEAAEAACRDGQLERARERLSKLARKDLPRRDHARAAALVERLSHAEAVERLTREYHHRLEAGDLMAACSSARSLAEAAGEAAERELWGRRVEQVGERLRGQWRLEVLAGEAPLGSLGDFDPAAQPRRTGLWLGGDARELVLATAWDRWLFVRIADVETQAVTTRLCLRTPEPLAERVYPWLDGERLWVAGFGGGVLALDRAGWQVVFWRNLGELLPEGARITDLQPIPETPYLWVGTGHSGPSLGYHVVDLGRWQVCRRHATGSELDILPGPGSPHLLLRTPARPARLLTARGTPVPGGEIPSGGVLGAAPGPREDTLVVALQAPAGQAREGEIELVLFERSGVAGPLEPRLRSWVDDLSGEEPCPPEGAVPGSMSYFFFEAPGGGMELRGFGLSEAGFRLAYRLWVPDDTLVAQDPGGRRRVAMMPQDCDDAPLLIAPFGARPPRAPARPAVAMASSFRLSGLGRQLRLPCELPTQTSRGYYNFLVAHLGPICEADAVWLCREFVAEYGHQVDALVAALYALEQRRGRSVPEDEEEILEALARHHPGHLAGPLVRVRGAVASGRWDDVLAGLEGLRPGSSEEAWVAHLHHLRGIAWLRAGEIPRARAELERGAALAGGHCELDSWLALARAMTEPPGARGARSGEHPVRQVLAAIGSADQALDRGDPAAAVEALDRPSVWRSPELQSAARMAAAWLEIEPATPAERFAKRMALARLCHLRTTDSPTTELPLGDLGWEEERLERVESQARAWLERAQD